MKSQKIVLMAIAVVATGMFALPSTVALFNGQHSWYDLSSSIKGASGRNNVPCEKCHADIADEMSSGENGVHRDLTCAMCHRAPFTDYTYARGHYYIGSGYLRQHLVKKPMRHLWSSVWIVMVVRAKITRPTGNM